MQEAREAWAAADGAAEPLLRYLGPVMAGALVDDDVTELYVNPHDHQVRVEEPGQPVQFTELGERELRRERPLLSGRATYGLRVEGQRYVQPLEYVQSLAAAVAGRRAAVETGTTVRTSGLLTWTCGIRLSRIRKRLVLTTIFKRSSLPVTWK